ncbi:MAG: hypothetical protein KDA41_01275, partial [Planctomycetales bacterium]|nr:hypothetical protein [Planctomycetales bacterium]
VIVSANRLGAVNATLQTLVAAAAWRQGLPVAGVVLCDVSPDAGDASRDDNPAELKRRMHAPLLAHVRHGATQFDPPLDWRKLASAEPV